MTRVALVFLLVMLAMAACEFETWEQTHLRRRGGQYNPYCKEQLQECLRRIPVWTSTAGRDAQYACRDAWDHCEYPR